MTMFATNDQRQKFTAEVKRWLYPGSYTVQGHHVSGQAYSFLQGAVRDDWRRGNYGALPITLSFEALLDEAGFKVVHGINNRNAPCRIVIQKEAAAKQ